MGGGDGGCAAPRPHQQWDMLQGLGLPSGPAGARIRHSEGQVAALQPCGQLLSSSQGPVPVLVPTGVLSPSWPSLVPGSSHQHAGPTSFSSQPGRRPHVGTGLGGRSMPGVPAAACPGTVPRCHRPKSRSIWPQQQPLLAAWLSCPILSCLVPWQQPPPCPGAALCQGWGTCPGVPGQDPLHGCPWP